MRKRYICLLLCVILCFGLFALPAAAEEASGEPSQEPAEIIEESVVPEDVAAASVTAELDDEEDIVPLDGGSSTAAIMNDNWDKFFDEANDKQGNPGSLSFKSTLESCQLGGNTDLSDDCNELDINTKVTLDLRGYTLKLNRLVVRSGGTLTLTDSLGGGKVVLIGRAGYGVALSVDGTLNANGGKVICQNGYGFSIEGTVTSNGTTPTEFHVDESVTIFGTVSGGTFYNELTAAGKVTDTGTVMGTVAGHRVTFKNGDTYYAYATQVVADGQKVGTVTAPSKTDHNFIGWYTDAACTKLFDSTTPVTENITLYAGFESAIASATVTAGTLTYNSSEQGLVTAKNVYRGTVMYSMDANADRADYTASIPKGKNAGTYRVYWYVKASSGYTDSEIYYTDVTIKQRTVEPLVMLPIGITYTYNGSEIKPTVTVKDGGAVIPASEYNVQYINNRNAGTATVKVTNNNAKENGNYIIQETTTTFTIEKAELSATVLGRPGLTYNGEEQALVTPSLVQGGTVMYRLGESGTYSAALPKAKDVGSYTVYWYVEGDSNHKDTSVKSLPVTIALPADVGDAVEGLTPERVTSDSRGVIEDTLKKVQDYLEMDLTEDETTELRALEQQLEQLLDTLDEVENALEDKTITDADDINASNATASDKKKLEEAKNAIEKLLGDFGANLTDAEKQELNAKLERIEAALQASEQAEQAKPQSPKTGDEENMMLWLALMTMSVFGIALVRRKKVK